MTHVSIFGGKRAVLPTGWTSETVVCVFGGADLDVAAPPGPDARVKIFALLGGASLRVARGSRVQVGGFSLLGGREVDITPGDGPEITVTAWTILGGVKIREA